MLYQASGRNAEVEGFLRAALQRDPDFFPALVTLVQWLEANGRNQEGHALLAQSLKDRPDSGLLQHTQGLALIRAGHTAEAMPYLRKAAQLEPQSGQFGYVLAVALHDSGKIEEACAELERLLKKQPANRNARLSLIQYYLDNGQEPKAQVLLQGWKKLNIGDPALKCRETLVGASSLAMESKPTRLSKELAFSLRSIASELAPTGVIRGA
ncbi:tetratricopeptide repeat protein [Pseudomonas sp. GM55]|nr:tetratricopeptide repeat protein [Pseudomonas sp. GM55]